MKNVPIQVHFLQTRQSDEFDGTADLIVLDVERFQEGSAAEERKVEVKYVVGNVEFGEHREATQTVAYVEPVSEAIVGEI